MALPKEIIEQIQKEAEDNYPFPTSDHPIDNDFYKTQDDRKEAYIAGATAWAEKIPQWISVKDKLPEAYKDCLVFYREESRIAALYPDGWEDERDNEITPTHWMPLPHSPKIKQDETE